tara:strand:- start:696 stop:1037 length:342 start_codon:yes stop_codon:yes gene_type:complete
MTKILANAQEHFKSKLSGGLDKLPVPEWKTDVYYKASYSFAVESKIIELQQQGKTVEALCETLIQKAMDPEGKPMFNRMDKLTLMNEVDPAVILRIAAVLNSTTSSYEAIEKN